MERAARVAAMWLPAREAPPSGEAHARGRARAGGLERTVGQLHLPSVAKIARTASASACTARRAGSTSASDARRAAFTSVPVLTGAARADRRSSCCRAAFVSSCAMIIYNRGDHRLEKGLQHVGIWAIACCGSCLRSSAERPDGESGASDGIPNRCKHQKVGSGSSSRRADPDTRALLKSRGRH